MLYPSCRMATVGFDFGNLNCLIARAGRGGVDVLLNGGSNRLVSKYVEWPSVKI